MAMTLASKIYNHVHQRHPWMLVPIRAAKDTMNVALHGEDYPNLVHLMITTRCNLRCRMCKVSELGKHDLTMQKLRKLDKLISRVRVVHASGIGEATLHPEYTSILNHIYKLNDRENLIHLVTNGAGLSPRLAKQLSGHLGHLTVSLNAATAETYEADMQRGNFAKTLSSIRRFLPHLLDRERGRVTLSFVAGSSNYSELPNFVRLTADMGIRDIGVLHHRVSSWDDFEHTLLPVRDAYMETLRQAEDIAKDLGVGLSAPHFNDPRVGNPRQCPIKKSECVIWYNGAVVPCCFFMAPFNFGNAYDTSFESVWFSRRYRDYRRDGLAPSCKSCVVHHSPDHLKTHFMHGFVQSSAFRKGYEDYMSDQKRQGDN